MLYKLTLAFILIFSTAVLVAEEAQELPKQVLFKNVNIFDGKNDKLTMGQDVLVEGNKIKKIGKGLKSNKGLRLVAICTRQCGSMAP